MDNEPTLKELAGLFFDAKRREDEAKKNRIEIEEMIASLVPTPENGSKTVEAGDGLKVTVKRSLKYEADLEEIQKLDDSIAGLPIKIIPSKMVFDEKAYEAIREKSPKAFQMISSYVTVTPKKTSVTLKLA